jgi:streptomycin 6-kinase
MERDDVVIDLPRDLLALTDRLLAEMHGRASASPGLLHGDLHERNLMRTSLGPKVIDPFGLIGNRSFDVALFATQCESADPRRVAQKMEAAYGVALPNPPHFFAWCMVRGIVLNGKYFDRPQHAETLQKLTDELLRIGDPVAFFRANESDFAD